MRPQAHVAASLLVWSWDSRPLWEAPVHTLAGNLPDLDRNVARALGVKRRDHHRWVSHSFVGWFPPTVLALAVARGSRHAPAVRRSVLSLWVHLLLDTYADGIAWLWPLHKDKVGLFQGSPEIKDQGWRTPAPLSTRLGKAELAMWAGVAANLLRRRRPR